MKDGIKYKSSVSKEGNNILLFDTSKETRAYGINGSKVITVKSMNVDYDVVFPFGFEERLNV